MMEFYLTMSSLCEYEGIKMMKRIEHNDQIKKLLLDELMYFDSICKRNNIRYSLMYGTLLGAVRHKGFIPWDDDIDVFIHRKDYEKLCQVVQDDENYGVLSVYNSTRYNSIIPKFYNKKTRIVQKREGRINNTINNSILGIYLDLFVIDDLPNSKFLRLLKLKYHDFLQLIWSFAYFVPNEKHTKLLNSVRRIVNKTNLSVFVARYIDRLARKKIKDAVYCGNLLKCGFNKRSSYVFEKKYFDNLISLLFEGRELPSLPNYDYWLKNEYGDYMKLPSVEKRVSNHDFDAYFIV